MKRYAAELIGTFVLVFGGCGAAVLAGSHIGFEGVAFAFGFSLLVMAYAIGPVFRMPYQSSRDLRVAAQRQI
jgi:aquaporin Z